MIPAMRQALRSLRLSPAFALTVVATLAIGIGLNAAIFTIVDNVLLRPLGYRDADRIVAIRTHFDDQNRSIPRLGGEDYSDLARQVSGLEAAAYYRNHLDGMQFRGSSLYVPVAQVSPQFAEVMGVQAIAGRLFRGSDAEGTDVLLSEAFTNTHFDSPLAAIGQTITYNGEIHTVVGVLPAGFSFPGKTEVWFESTAKPHVANRTAYNQQVVAKRRTGTSRTQLAAELTTFSKNLRRQFPEDHNKSIEAVPLQEQIVGSIRPTLHLLMAAVAVILLIVCANITHLLLVRATRQLRGATIRVALGASRRALAAYALLEIAFLATASSSVAMILASLALSLLIRLAPPDTPRLTDVHLNFDVLLFSFLIALAVMILAALLPVWRSWHVDPASALRSDSSRGTESRNALRLRSSFIVAQVALTLTLSVCAILLTRQLIAQSREDLGFHPDSLLTLDTHAIATNPFPVAGGSSPQAFAALREAENNAQQAKLNKLDAILASIGATPGVDSVAAISGAPMGFGGSDVSYAIKGRSVFAPSAKLPNAEFLPITPGLIETMQIRLLQGRTFTAEDRQGTPGIVLINEKLAEEIFPGQNPLGQQIMCGYDRDLSWLTIVGVVADIRSESPASPPTPTLYAPIAQHPREAADMQLVVRTALPPAALAQTLVTRLHHTHPEVAVKATTMRENIGVQQQSDRFRTLLFTLFAAVSILLAAIGMYGVTAYSVAQRRFEFGLRFALGAMRGQVLGMVLREALSVAGIGIVAGVLLSLGLLHLAASVVGRLPGFDLPSYALAAAGVLFIALLATFLPAQRAASVEPMTVLRSE